MATRKTTPEGIIKNAIMDYLKFRGIFCWVVQSVGIWDTKKKIFRSNQSRHHIKGQSDIMFIYKSRFGACEVKSKNGYPTEEQKAFLERVNKEGGIGFVARSIDDVIAHLKMLDDRG